MMLVVASAMTTIWESGNQLYAEGINAPANTTLILKAYLNGQEMALASPTTDSQGAFTTSFDKSTWASGIMRVCYGTASNEICSNTITPLEVTATQFNQLNSTLTNTTAKLSNLTADYNNFTGSYNFTNITSRLGQLEDLFLNENDNYAKLRDELNTNYSTFQSDFTNKLTALQTNFTNLTASNDAFKTETNHQLGLQTETINQIKAKQDNLTETVTMGFASTATQSQRLWNRVNSNFMLGIITTLILGAILLAGIWHFFLNKRLKNELAQEWQHDINAIKRGDLFEAIRQEPYNPEPAKPPQKKHCIATTRSGKQCQRPATEGSDYCAIHKLQKEHGDEYTMKG